MVRSEEFEGSCVPSLAKNSSVVTPLKTPSKPVVLPRNPEGTAETKEQDEVKTTNKDRNAFE